MTSVMTQEYHVAIFLRIRHGRTLSVTDTQLVPDRSTLVWKKFILAGMDSQHNRLQMNRNQNTGIFWIIDQLRDQVTP
jgi:hypothetical protein